MGFHRVVRAASTPAIVLVWIVTCCLGAPAAAIGLLRDPDIERSLSNLSAPILQAAGLTQPWAVITPRPIEGFQIYDVNTTASDIQPGDVVLETAYGEPSGVLLTGRTTELITEWGIHAGRVSAWRIKD